MQGLLSLGALAEEVEAGSIDTVVATNLHADILTDLAAALSGSPSTPLRRTPTAGPRAP